MQIVELIHGRRKLKRGYEYEVQWKGQPLDKNEWLTRDQLEEMGFQKMLNEIDIKEAAKMGLVQRPLTGLHLSLQFSSLSPRAEFAQPLRVPCLFLDPVIQRQ